MIRKLLLTLVVALYGAIAIGQERWDGQYEGPWVVTEGRPLQGIQTANVATANGQDWAAVITGRWQGEKFRYEIQFSGPAHDLRGTATIDGTPYDWKGTITADKFQGTFRSHPYGGHFNMTRTK